MNDSKFQPTNVQEQLELPFPKEKAPTNKDANTKKLEGVMIYALTPPFVARA